MKALRQETFADFEPEMPDGPVADKAAWLPGDFKQPSDWQYRLDGSDLKELDAALKRVRQAGLDMIEIERDDFQLPGLGRKLAELKREVLDGRGFILLRGLPVDDYSRLDIATLYWGIGLHLGYPVSQNGRGHLMGHVVGLDKPAAVPEKPVAGDLQGERRALSIYNSRSRLNFHIDLCDIVGLFCLHPAKSGGLSMIAGSISVHNEIMRRRPDLLKVLYRPFLTSRMEEIPAGAKPYFPMPVFHWHQGRLTTFFIPGFIRNADKIPGLPPLSAEQREALDLVQEIASEPKFQLAMDLETGDAQFLNNHVTLHTRTEWEDYPEPERKRHLLRLWLVTPEARPLSHWIHDCYRAGRRGGVYVPGMKEVASLDA